MAEKRGYLAVLIPQKNYVMMHCIIQNCKSVLYNPVIFITLRIRHHMYHFNPLNTNYFYNPHVLLTMPLLISFLPFYIL